LARDFGKAAVAGPPRAVAEKVPLSISAGSVHDDPMWQIEVRRKIPNLPIIQLSEPLAEFGWTAESLSRSTKDRTKEYIGWGINELADASARARGDYFLTSPVAAAVAAGSLLGVFRSMVAGARWGRPGPWAWIYAAAAIGRILARRAYAQASRFRGWVQQGW
jgi:hypothetical protein